MKSLVLTGALILAILGVPASAAVKLEISAGARSEINVTTDSSRGWTPTNEQRERALKAVQAFLDAIEGSRYAEAYRLLTEGNQRQQTLARFTEDAQKFQTLAGPLKAWRILKVTWTKDSARAPLPGIYAAIDLAGKFTNVDRSCGYIILYQQSDGGDFAVMRRENNYLDNATARDIEKKHSKAEVAKIWVQLSRHCPNYDPS